VSVQVLDVIFFATFVQKVILTENLRGLSKVSLAKPLRYNSEGNSFFGQSAVHGAHMGICCHSNDTAPDSLAFHLFFSV